MNIEDVKKIIKPPFKYIPEGQMIFDSENHYVLDVRGWGLFQYQENGMELQDTFGEEIVKALNKHFGETNDD